MLTGIRAPLCALFAAVCLAPFHVASAQDYPSRSITIVVPSAAGGGTDTLTRLVADQLSRQLGQSVVVENRTGGGMLVGTAAVAKANPDGYTLLTGLTGNMSVNPSLFSNLPYDPIKDFVPVAMLADYPFLVVVGNPLSATSIKALIELAKAKPGQLDFASAGNGTGQHLAAELFKMMAGVDMTHVAYKGAQPAYHDVMTGRVPVFFDNMSTAMTFARSGKVRALAITSKTRSTLMPELVTVEEAGLKGYEYHTWFGLWAPAGTPDAVVMKLNAEVKKALADPDVQKKIEATAGQVSAMPREAITPFVKDEIDKWAKVVKQAKIKVQ